MGRARREGQESILGFNFRLSEVQAATVLAGLEALEGQLATRDANGRLLNRRLAQIPGIRPARRDARVVRQAYYGYIFGFDPQEWGIPRERFLKALNAEGVQAGRGFPPVYQTEYWHVRKERFPAASRYDPTAPDFQQPHLPVTERLALEQQVTLPHVQLLGTEEDMEDIVRAVEKLYRGRQELIQQPAVAIA